MKTNIIIRKTSPIEPLAFIALSHEVKIWPGGRVCDVKPRIKAVPAKDLEPFSDQVKKDLLGVPGNREVLH